MTGQPRPLLSRRAENKLGARHRQILDQLEALFLEDGFASWSVRELAATVGCSRRTLYELAASKDELVLIVFDRFLHRIGRAALDAIDPADSYSEQLRAYFRGGVELQRMSRIFGDDLADDPAATRLFNRHYDFVMLTTAKLIENGIAAGEFRPLAPHIAARVITGAGQLVTQPSGRSDQEQLTDLCEEIIDIVLTGIKQ